MNIVLVTLLAFLCTSCQKEEVSIIRRINQDIDQTNEIFMAELTSDYEYFSVFQLDTQDDIRKLNIQLYSNEGNKRTKISESNFEMSVEKAYIYCQVENDGKIIFGVKAEKKTTSRTMYKELFTFNVNDSWNIICDEIDSFEFHGNEPFPLVAFYSGNKDLSNHQVKLSDYDQNVTKDADIQYLFLILTLQY